MLDENQIKIKIEQYIGTKNLNKILGVWSEAEFDPTNPYATSS